MGTVVQTAFMVGMVWYGMVFTVCVCVFTEAFLCVLWYVKVF